MSIEFIRENRSINNHERIKCDSTRLTMAYDSQNNLAPMQYRLVRTG